MNDTVKIYCDGTLDAFTHLSPENEILWRDFKNDKPCADMVEVPISSLTKCTGGSEIDDPYEYYVMCCPICGHFSAVDKLLIDPESMGLK